MPNNHFDSPIYQQMYTWPFPHLELPVNDLDALFGTND